jgi:hypothetical protein
MFFKKIPGKRSLYREIPVIEIGKPNSIGNIYTEKSVERILNSFKGKTSLIGELISGYTQKGEYETTLSNATHIIKHIYIEDEFVIAVIKFLETKRAMDAMKMLGDGMVTLRPTISGIVNEETKEIDVHDIMSIDLLPIDDRFLQTSIDWIKIK